MTDARAIDFSCYIKQLNNFFEMSILAGAQILDDIDEFPTVKPVREHFPIRPDYMKYTRNTVIALIEEAMSSAFVFSSKRDASPELSELLRTTDTRVFDWFFQQDYIDNIICDISNKVYRMIKGADVHRSYMFLISENNLVLVMGEDYRITMYNDRMAVEQEGAAWSKNLSALCGYMYDQLSMTDGSYVPLTQVLTIGQIIHVIIATNVTNVTMNNRLYLNRLLNTIGETVDSVGFKLRTILQSTGILSEIRGALNSTTIYDFSLSNVGRASITPSVSVSARERRFRELEEIVDTGGYLPKEDREFYEKELRYR